MREEVLKDLYENRYTYHHDLLGFLRKEFPNLLQQQVCNILIEMMNDRVITGVESSTGIPEVGGIFYWGDHLKLMSQFSPDARLYLKITNLGIKELNDFNFREQVKIANEAAISQSKSSISTNESLRTTNQSIIDLNKKTERYYESLKKATWVMALATGLYALFTLIQIFISIFSTPQYKQEQPKRSTNLHLEGTLKYQKENDTVYYIEIHPKSQKR